METTQQDRPVLNITIPAKHMEIRLVRAHETWLLGGRGSLKTTFGIAMYNIDMIYEMPRSTGVMICLNYEHFKLNTLSPLLKGWANLGYRMDEHFVMNKRPPDGWPRALDYCGEKDFNWTFCWHNGTFIKVISLARLAAANAVSAQWGSGDELKFMKKKRLDEVLPIFRPGNDDPFKNCNGYLSKFFATDKKADPGEIEWILDKRKLVDHDKVANIIAGQLRVNELKSELNNHSKKEQEAIKLEIFDIETLLRKERQELVFVPEINCYDVLPLLGEKWLQSSRSTCTSMNDWEVIYENKDPDKPEACFYPNWDDDIHLYDTTGDEDIDLSKPFIIAADYQHSVAPIPVAQLGKLPCSINDTLNYVDYVYGLHPEGLKSTVKKFCDRYSDHHLKRVYYVYDHTAIGRRLDADDYCTIVIKELKANGWTVTEVNTGQAPLHFQKYSDTLTWMKPEEDTTLPQIRMHRRRCAHLRDSIANAPAKMVSGKTEKDKKYEDTKRYPDLDQSKTTHGSDAFDMICDAVLKQKLIKISADRFPFFFR